MAVSTRTMKRQRDYSRLFIALGVMAGVMAIAPIVAAVLGIGGATVTRAPPSLRRQRANTPSWAGARATRTSFPWSGPRTPAR